MRKRLKENRSYLLIIVFGIFSIISLFAKFEPGRMIADNFVDFFIEMISFIPFLFIIVGLFDVWVPKEKIERHIGHGSGIRGIFFVVLLAMLQAGPLYGAFPVAYILYKKGASIRNIFIYLGAFSAMKIPMLGIEVGYLGWKFTLVRTAISIPLFTGIGYFMEYYLRNRNFVIQNIKKS